MSGHAATIRKVLYAPQATGAAYLTGGMARDGLAALDALVAEVQQQADRIAWLEGEVAGWRIKNQQLRDALNAVQAVAVMAQSPRHVDAATRLEWLNEIECRARSALDGTPSEDTG